MSDNTFIVQTPIEVAAYNDGNNKTILQLKAPATMKVKILGWGVFFDGTSITNSPVEVMLYRQTSTGTMTLLTPVKLQDVSESINTTASYGAIVEPTTSDLLDAAEVHPQSGYQVSYNDSEIPIVPQDGYVGLVVNASSSVNIRAKIICEE